MTSDSAKSRKSPRRWTFRFLGVLVVVLALVVFASNWYWVPQAEATQRAKEYMKQAHPKVTYDSIHVWKKWDGHWAVEFDSAPKVLVDVDRHGSPR